jgi:hypothetical protein
MGGTSSYKKFNYKFGTDTGIEKPSVLYYSLGVFITSTPDSRLEISALL